MGMPPPLEPEIEEEESTDYRIPQVNINGIIDRVKKLELGDYLFALGAGLRAFHDARKRRQDHDVEEK